MVENIKEGSGGPRTSNPKVSGRNLSTLLPFPRSMLNLNRSYSDLSRLHVFSLGRSILPRRVRFLPGGRPSTINFPFTDSDQVGGMGLDSLPSSQLRRHLYWTLISNRSSAMWAWICMTDAPNMRRVAEISKLSSGRANIWGRSLVRWKIG